MILATWSQFRAVFMPGAPIGIDGVEEWDPSMVDQPGFVNDLVFADPITFPWEIEVDPGPDAVPGVDEFDFFLSQRSDDPAKQYWEVQRNDAGFPGITNSGRIKLARTSLSTSLYPTVTAQSTAALITLFKDLDLYVYRRSDGLIQHRLLEDVLFQ